MATTTLKSSTTRLNESQTEKILIDDAIKIYKRGKIEVVALRGLSCEFRPGEITVIMGPSGCGKTTLLNMIGGLDRLNSGKIFVDGEDIAQFSDTEVEKYRRQKIGFVFQFMNLIPELNALENITLPLELSGTLTKERKNFINELLQIVGLEDRKNHRPDELSGGEQQRISIAAALANDPEIVLCDEPTGELDSQSKKVIMDLLRSVIEKFPEKTMIIVSHDPELKAIADNMLYIRDGNISHTFTKEEIIASQQSKDSESSSKTYFPSNPNEANEKVLLELRELNHIILDRINQIEKKMHPI
ncbi:Vitamin B12 import ATP-binding protein BtuD [Candidatus Lokiarchaeum ossiferum]|uniref:Vitamin B12 import ATP-binding protein BtuD n=1 Tax=Candidatus Lokiarchaeum ossiferum TaxID=2951803 RepID=A0ABY6HPL2_9ARCH|nr:Vitamin B12 import ATP-binding protein BtuD [Candidatus Lokiarchaeum sp. B-35]